MNENFEKYIEGLSPELQEKARACKTKEELNAFLAENELELPEDALDVVAGGCGTSTCDHKSRSTIEEYKGITVKGAMSGPFNSGYWIKKDKCASCGGDVRYWGTQLTIGINMLSMISKEKYEDIKARCGV